MALLSGFEPLNANTDTVSTLVTKVNVVIDEMRDHVVTANNTLANTNGNARINGLFVSNTSYVIDGLAIGDFLVETTVGSDEVLVSNTAGISEGDVILINEAFAPGTTVANVTSESIILSTNALKSSQYVGTFDESTNNAIQFSRFGLSGAIPGANADIDIETANLYIVSNTIFTTDCDLVTVEANLQVDTDSLFVGNVKAQSTIEFTGDDSILEFNGANQDFVWLSTNTYATIRTNDAGSLELNADVAANGDNDSSIELMVDSINVASFFEGGDIAFYSADGLNQKIYWDATNEVLGINTTNANPDVELDVVGNTQTIDLVVTSETTSGNVVVNDELRGNTVLTVTSDTNFSGNNTVTVDNDLLVDNELVANIATITTELRGNNSNLIISSNTVFQANGIAEDNFTVNGALTVSTANLIYKLVPDNYDDLIPSANTGDLLGNTTNRWEGFFNNINTDTLDVSGDVSIGDTLTVQNLTVAGNGVVSLPPTTAFTGVTEFENITVTGTANIVSLEVESLTTNAAALVGAGGVANGTSPTVIDDFDKTVSKGFKYIVHGENGDPDSAYAIEINCSHNGANVFFTRFGEVSNKFDCDLTPKINATSEKIELVAVCPSANSSNVHSFNILRIETR